MQIACLKFAIKSLNPNSYEGSIFTLQDYGIVTPPLEEPSTLAPQTQSQQAAPPRRSGSGGGMFKFLVPRGEGEIGTRTFG